MSCASSSQASVIVCCSNFNNSFCFALFCCCFPMECCSIAAVHTESVGSRNFYGCFCRVLILLCIVSMTEHGTCIWNINILAGFQFSCLDSASPYNGISSIWSLDGKVADPQLSFIALNGS